MTSASSEGSRGGAVTQNPNNTTRLRKSGKADAALVIFSFQRTCVPRWEFGHTTAGTKHRSSWFVARSSSSSEASITPAAALRVRYTRRIDSRRDTRWGSGHSTQGASFHGQVYRRDRHTASRNSRSFGSCEPRSTGWQAGSTTERATYRDAAIGGPARSGTKMR